MSVTVADFGSPTFDSHGDLWMPCGSRDHRARIGPGGMIGRPAEPRDLVILRLDPNTDETVYDFARRAGRILDEEGEPTRLARR